MQHLFWGLLVGCMLWLSQPAHADTTLETLYYRCDDSPLAATLHTGAVDLPTAPNTVDGLAPGSFVVLNWQEQQLQLPRTNNAGAPSFTDGKWWWSLEDPEQPSFRLRLGVGQVQDFSCRIGP